MVVEIILSYPRASIIVISVLVSLFITLVNYFVLDKEKVRRVKARQKELRAEMKLAKGDAVKTMELNKELMAQTMDNMKDSFKPMLITFIPIIVVFWWIRGTFAETSLSGTWFWWYLGAAIIGSILFRKLFKLP